MQLISRNRPAFAAAFAAVVVIAVAALCAAPSSHAASYKPKAGAPYYMGQSNRFQLSGDWYLKRDFAKVGTKQRWNRTTNFSSWDKIRIPNAFNAGDTSELSYTGYVAWYATEFNRPSNGRNWIFSFDNVNLNATFFLNGREVGRHRGGYLPFDIPATKLRSGKNRLIVRIDSSLSSNSIPSVEERSDQLTGGWWNFGGIMREVVLRRVDKFDISSVTTRSSFKGTRGPATITVLARVKNYSKAKRTRLRLRGSYGGRKITFKTVRLRRGATAELTGRVRISKPKLWEPLSPNLYKVKVSAPGVSYREKAGIRKLTVNKGVFRVNGKSTRLRGVSFHESDPQTGAAWTSAQRKADMALMTKIGVNMIRSHYPLSREILEWADAKGIFVWTQAPVFRPRNTQVKSARYRSAAAAYVREMVLAHRMHPSILVWSLINEPVPATSGSPFLTKLIQAEKVQAKQLDPQGLVGVDYATAPEDFVQQEGFRMVDVLGVNEYFGWYPGSLGSTLDIAGLRPYLDYIHRTYPNQAKFITEFGTESNRNGPVDEPGTYGFQVNFFNNHLRILRDVPYLNGLFAWALKDYWVRPGWTGGNPDPQPPFSRKGLFDEKGNPKPAAAVVERDFKNTPPFK